MSKVVLITGGSSGIGKSVGEYLIQKEFVVYGTSRNPENYKNSKFPILQLDVKKQILLIILLVLLLMPKVK